MPLVPSFSIAVGSTPNSFTITDSSSGSDVAITDRQILLYQASNALLVPAIDFPLSAGASITISPLTQDVALNVVLNWVDNTGATLYSTSLIYSFTAFAEAFFYTLIQSLSSTPTTINDTNFALNFYKLRVLIDATPKAIIAGDIGGAQVLISLYQGMIKNAAYNF